MRLKIIYTFTDYLPGCLLNSFKVLHQAIFN